MKVTPTKQRIGIYKPGDPFEITEKIAKHLIKCGVVKAYTEADSTPAPVARRRYNRRDMTAGV